MPSRVVLITGCSTGIGRDLALHLSQAGYTVAATARRPDALADLDVALKLPLDVTRDESVQKAVVETVEHFGRIDVLVNNAGYAVRGAVEELSDEQLRQVFEVNVYGLVRMVRAVVPHMRAQMAGYIVNVGSIAGRATLPVNGAYSSTKYAVESLSDALRLELLPFGIRVILVEPGNIRTNFAETSQAHSTTLLSNPNSPYAALYRQYVAFSTRQRHNDPGPEVLSAVIRLAIETPHPKARYVVAVPFANRLAIAMGDTLRDAIMKRMLKIEGPMEEGSNQ